MRVHITLDDDLVRRLDKRVGSRQRSGFIAQAVEQALDDEQRWELIQSAVGSIGESGHDWDGDSAKWVRGQRRSSSQRVG